MVAYQPGEGALELPRKLGPSEEIQELRDAFGRAIDRVEESERETTAALEGQRRLVREVHHRVKNNLQVVASLLNIHGRSAETSRRALRLCRHQPTRGRACPSFTATILPRWRRIAGISLRPLVTELAAELRAGAPEAARGVRIDLDLDTLYTTQDAAVAVAFLITEIVEFAMLNAPQEPIELSLRRTSELTARLTIGSPILGQKTRQNPAKPSSSASSSASPSSSARRSTESLVATALIYPYFPQIDERARSLRHRRKKFENLAAARN